MRSVSHAKHAKRSLHPLRSTLSAGLTAALLPLCLATPALAETTSPTSAVALPSTQTATKTATTTALSGPTSLVWKGTHSLPVRLRTSSGAAIAGAYVRIQKYTSSGWVHVGTVTTNAYGNVTARPSVSATTTFRAVYAGSATRAASTSANVQVRVMTFRERAVRVAAAQQGEPYRYGAVGPDSFDCSGLMVYSFKAAGKSLPRTSRDQYNATTHLAKTSKARGDLIFIHSSGRITHVGVYAGDNKIWVAPKTGDVVKLQTIYTSSYYVGRVR